MLCTICIQEELRPCSHPGGLNRYSHSLIEFQKEQEEDDQQHQPPNQTNLVLDIVQQLAKAMRDNTTTDISDPNKFSGEDHHI